MATKADFTADEWDSLHTGVTGAGMLVSLSDRDLSDSFGESTAMAKYLAGQVTAGPTQLIREIAGVHGTGFGFTASPEKVRAKTMDVLTSSMATLSAKARTRSTRTGLVVGNRAGGRRGEGRRDPGRDRDDPGDREGGRRWLTRPRSSGRSDRRLEPDEWGHERGAPMPRPTPTSQRRWPLIDVPIIRTTVAFPTTRSDMAESNPRLSWASWPAYPDPRRIADEALAPGEMDVEPGDAGRTAQALVPRGARSRVPHTVEQLVFGPRSTSGRSVGPTDVSETVPSFSSRASSSPSASSSWWPSDESMCRCDVLVAAPCGRPDEPPAGGVRRPPMGSKCWRRDPGPRAALEPGAGGVAGRGGVADRPETSPWVSATEVAATRSSRTFARSTRMNSPRPIRHRGHLPARPGHVDLSKKNIRRIIEHSRQRPTLTRRIIFFLPALDLGRSGLPTMCHWVALVPSGGGAGIESNQACGVLGGDDPGPVRQRVDEDLEASRAETWSAGGDRGLEQQQVVAGRCAVEGDEGVLFGGTRALQAAVEVASRQVARADASPPGAAHSTSRAIESDCR